MNPSKVPEFLPYLNTLVQNLCSAIPRRFKPFKVLTTLVPPTQTQTKSFTDSILTLVSVNDLTLCKSAVNLATETIKGIDTELCCEIAESSFLQDLFTVLQPLQIQSDESSLHGNLLELITILLSSLSSFGLQTLEDSRTTSKTIHFQKVISQLVEVFKPYVHKFCLLQNCIDSTPTERWLLALITLMNRIYPYQSYFSHSIASIPIPITITTLFISSTNEETLGFFVFDMLMCLYEWKNLAPSLQNMGQASLRRLISEGFEDAVEARQQNDQSQWRGRNIVKYCSVLLVILRGNVLSRF
ncbi:hypothetical protein BLNAU_5599 [Blattamonas nauphoetae]|uniref:Uncharacterized protein n=1 Tax=Blattamonas nauphoetae TaxID=2049346 RepID=A0ABQ9Y731_9EUKA|nr:hypothetical protein BLNAU_5599 [Blattamonas nauphoetae]